MGGDTRKTSVRRPLIRLTFGHPPSPRGEGYWPKATKNAPSRTGSGRTKTCPWFHLNSCLADMHFVPDNGGGRRAISCPQRPQCLLHPGSGGLHQPPSLCAPPGEYCSATCFCAIVLYQLHPVKGNFEGFFAVFRPGFVQMSKNRKNVRKTP